MRCFLGEHATLKVCKRAVALLAFACVGCSTTYTRVVTLRVVEAPTTGVNYVLVPRLAEPCAHPIARGETEVLRSLQGVRVTWTTPGRGKLRDDGDGTYVVLLTESPSSRADHDDVRLERPGFEPVVVRVPQGAPPYSPDIVVMMRRLDQPTAATP